MQAAPAYLLAVLTASTVLSLEIGAVGAVRNLMAGIRPSLGEVFYGLLGALTFFPFFIFAFAVFIAIFPFLLFYPAYKKQHGAAARNMAMVFGVFVAFAGLSLPLSLLPGPTGVGLWDTGLIALLGLMPGIASGWVFHEVISFLPASAGAAASGAEGDGEEQAS